MLQAGDPPPNGGPDEQEHGGDGLREERRKGRQDERLAAFDAAIEEIAARVLPVYRAADGWLERTRAGLLALLRALDELPDAAQALVVYSTAWGPEVLERRGELLEVLAEALNEGRGAAVRAYRGEQRARGKAGPAGELPETAGENLVGASLSWIHTRLRGAGGPLVELAPSLTSMVVHPYLGAEAAQRELERPLTDLGVEVAGDARPVPISRLRAAPS